MKHPGQLQLFESLPSERSASAWSAELSLRLGRPVKLSFGRARRNVIVAKRRGSELHVRLNEHFQSAPLEVREALGAWLKNGNRARRAGRILDAWIEELSSQLGRQPRRASAIRQVGTHFQLEPLALELIRMHFPGELAQDCQRPSAALPLAPMGAWHKRVSWGRRGSRRARRSIQLGSYDPEQRLIRIHPVLDQDFVPPFFLRYVIFHELLHAALDMHACAKEAMRGRPHPPAFQERERAYPDFQRALDWQKDNLGTLLNCARNLAKQRP